MKFFKNITDNPSSYIIFLMGMGALAAVLMQPGFWGCLFLTALVMVFVVYGALAGDWPEDV